MHQTLRLNFFFFFFFDERVRRPIATFAPTPR